MGFMGGVCSIALALALALEWEATGSSEQRYHIVFMLG